MEPKEKKATETVADGLMTIIADTLQEAEELGGLEGWDYLTFMRRIEKDVRRRQEVYYPTWISKLVDQTREEARDMGRDEANAFVSETIGAMCEKYYNTPTHDALMELSEKLGFVPPEPELPSGLPPHAVIAEATRIVNCVLGEDVALFESFHDTVEVRMSRIASRLEDHDKVLIFGVVNETWTASVYELDNSRLILTNDEGIATNLHRSCADPKLIARNILRSTWEWVERRIDDNYKNV